MLLDHGLYEVIEDDQRFALCELFKAIVMKDEAGMEEYSKLLGVSSKSKQILGQVKSFTIILYMLVCGT